MAKRKGSEKQDERAERDASCEAGASGEAKIESVSAAIAAASAAVAGLSADFAPTSVVEFTEDEADFVETQGEDGAELSEEELAARAALTDASDDESVVVVADEELSPIADADAGELGAFESAEVEMMEEISDEQLASVLESLLFATDRPQSVAMLKSAFQGTKIRAADIRRALDRLQMEYANPLRGVTLEEVAGGYQLRTKSDNQTFLQRTVKARPFRLSGPALEVLAIVAYKQPCTKAMVDEIRGVESGHLMRGLLDRGLLHFAGKSELPGRPMFYETTRKFLEIFGLRNLSELPTLNEIDQLIPEGIGEVAEEKQTLSDLTGELSTEVVAKSYSEGEEELMNISHELQAINTSSEFFEQEKKRQREKRDADRAQDIRERLTVGEAVDEKDQRWLARYEAELVTAADAAAQPEPEALATTTTEASATVVDDASAALAVTEITSTEDVVLTSAPDESSNPEAMT